MPSIKRLAQLSALVYGSLTPEEAIREGLPLLKEGLGASEVHLVYGWQDGFRSIGTTKALNFSDIALWLIQRDLTPRARPNAFDWRDDKVVGFRDATAHQPADYVGALLPVQTTSDMLVAKGPWPGGLSTPQGYLLNASLPVLGLLIERWLEGVRAERQRNQLSALANIPRVLSESDNLDTVLTSIASSIATVSGANYISIDVLDKDGNVSIRSVNGADRPGTAALTDRWKQGANRPDPVRDEVIRTRRPMLFPDAQNDERIPEPGRKFFIRTLIRSTAVFPLVAHDEVLGAISIASHHPIEFSDQDIELLEALGTQVATAVTGIRLYQELASSREELRGMNEQLRQTMGVEHHLARTDPLTGIPNRRFADETMEAEATRMRRYGGALSVVMADLDNLKEINDAHSHEAGDEALRFVASVARENCRGVDVVGRYGGDEFLFILPATNAEEAVAFAERFRRSLAERPLPVDGIAVPLTISIGVASWNPSTDGPASLIRQADHAMYQAKAGGRNRTVLAEDETSQVA